MAALALAALCGCNASQAVDHGSLPDGGGDSGSDSDGDSNSDSDGDTDTGSSTAPEYDGVVYVDGSNGSDANSGDSWATAKATIQPAIEIAWEETLDVWVAAGVYLPTAGDDREASFFLRHDVRLFGGFGGFEESLFERDQALYATVLSGDIGEPGVAEDNSYHVVTCDHYFEDCSEPVLDGVTITGGRADGDASDAVGGGLYIDSASPLISHVVVRGNHAHSGGGLYWDYHAAGGSNRVVSSLFVDNTAETTGGGAHFHVADPWVIGCTFVGSTAVENGGGIYNNYYSWMHVYNTILWDNEAEQGPNATNYYGSVSTFSDCIAEGGCTAVGSSDCSNVLDEQPLFADIDGLDLHLEPDSPGVDDGDGDWLPDDTWDLDGDGDLAEPYPTDLDTLPRVVGADVDIGAYELQEE